jgi:type VI secretion system protein
MVREERLLERIRSLEKAPNRRVGKDPQRMIDSILRHLQRILNTKRGNVPIADDFGLPDFTVILQVYPESLRLFERAIRQTLQKYEPRLKAARVQLMPEEEDRLSLHFQIIAQLALEQERIPVLFESYLDAGGKVNIRS